MTEKHTINFGSLLVQQIYTRLVAISRKEGGELKIRMNFILDEFANFTKIETFQSMLTVSRGRNIRFMICTQTLLSQLEEKYGKEGAQNIVDNCAILYLKSGNVDSANKISEMLGTYTAQSYGESSNSNIKYDKSSSSMSLISRKVLTADEVLKFESPYAIVIIAGEQPAITTIPDISKMYFNKLNDMGTREENQKLRIKREQARKENPIKPIKIWDIWNKQYTEEENETEITLTVTHNKPLSKVTYKWNNEETTEIQTKGRKEVSEVIEIPTGDNTLTIYAQDENGQETTYQKAYTLEGYISIDFELDGNNIKVIANGKNELTYMTYRWDDEEETRIDINNTQIEQDIEIPMGQHTLTVIVVDINNTTETKEQEIKGVTKPNLEITTDGASNFIIRVSDEEGLKRLEFTVNDTESYKLELEGRKELEYKWPIQDGENKLDVTVYNENDVTETMSAVVNK